MSNSNEATKLTYQDFRRRKWQNWVLGVIILIPLSYISILGSKVDLTVFNFERLWVLRYLEGFLQPEWSKFPEMAYASLATILLALLGTIFGAILSLVFGLMAANNLATKWLSNISRLLISLERAVSEVIIILLLIVVFGPGLFPGVLTLAIACIGMLGRLYADSIEEVDPKILESLYATGASKLEVIKYGIFPQVMPSFIAYTILRFEINIRASVMLGAIGAGGVGYELIEAYYHLEYGEMTVAILTILALVGTTERLSVWARKKIIEGEKLS